MGWASWWYGRSEGRPDVILGGVFIQPSIYTGKKTLGWHEGCWCLSLAEPAGSVLGLTCWAGFLLRKVEFLVAGRVPYHISVLEPAWHHPELTELGTKMESSQLCSCTKYLSLHTLSSFHYLSLLTQKMLILCSGMALGGRLGYFHSFGELGSLLPLLISFCSLFLFVHGMERDYLKCSGRTFPVTYCRF